MLLSFHGSALTNILRGLSIGVPEHLSYSEFGFAEDCPYSVVARQRE
jgi:hypothetical protein